MPRYLTPHFTLDELVASQTAARRGIDNTPPPDVLRNLQRLAQGLEEVRTRLGGLPLLISSGYRCPALNRAVKGAPNSLHMQGLAVDFTVPRFGTVLQTARAVAASGIAFNQVIHEFGSWVHLGLAPDGQPPAGEKLSIFTGTGYLSGLVGQPRLA